MYNTPTYIYKELKRRKVPVEIVYENTALMRYKVDGKWKLLKGRLPEETSSVMQSICDNKVLAELFAKEAGLLTPDSARYENDDQALKFMKKHGTIVVKPVSGAHGHGVSLNVSSKTALMRALRLAKKYSKRPILQQMVKGEDIRLLMIGGRFVAAVRRVPASVIGDGKHTIKELIEIENQSGKRSAGRRGRLKIISLKTARDYLQRKISKVPPKGSIVPVVDVSNTSKGGHAEDATDDLPEEMIKTIEKFVKHVRLPVCGVDVILNPNGDYYFIEANSQPGFGPHHHPRTGKSRDVTKVFVDYLMGQS